MGTSELFDDTFLCERCEKVEDLDPLFEPKEGGLSGKAAPTCGRNGNVSVMITSSCTAAGVYVCYRFQLIISGRFSGACSSV